MTHFAISLLLLVAPRVVVSPKTWFFVIPPAPGLGEALGDGLVDGDGDDSGEALGDGLTEADGSAEGEGLDVVWAKVTEVIATRSALEVSAAAIVFLIFMVFI